MILFYITLGIVFLAVGIVVYADYQTNNHWLFARVAELAYAHDLRSCSERNVVSMPTSGTKIEDLCPWAKHCFARGHRRSERVPSQQTRSRDGVAEILFWRKRNYLWPIPIPSTEKKNARLQSWLRRGVWKSSRHSSSFLNETAWVLSHAKIYVKPVSR